jgi:hypothetical protein
MAKVMAWCINYASRFNTTAGPIELFSPVALDATHDCFKAASTEHWKTVTR